MGPYPMCLKISRGGCGLMRLPRTCTLSFAVPRSVHRRPSYLLMVGKPSYIHDRGSNFWKVRTWTELFRVVIGHVATVLSRNYHAKNCAFALRTPVPASNIRRSLIQHLRELRKGAHGRAGLILVKGGGERRSLSDPVRTSTRVRKRVRR